MKKMIVINEQDIIKTKLEIQDQALKSIIQEIHDNIGQILSLAKLHLGTIDITKPEQVVQKTSNSKELIGKAIKDLRNLARHLSADTILQIGLYKSIEYEMNLLPRNRVGQTPLTLNGNTYSLPGEEELILFRIVQEVIHNFVRQSSTSVIVTHLQYQPELLAITIDNIENDVAMTSIQNENSTLQSAIDVISARAKLIGANFILTDILRNQSTVIITLPALTTKPK
jgi:signal transduction histidine kinase